MTTLSIMQKYPEEVFRKGSVNPSKKFKYWLVQEAIQDLDRYTEICEYLDNVSTERLLDYGHEEALLDWADNETMRHEGEFLAWLDECAKEKYELRDEGIDDAA